MPSDVQCPWLLHPGELFLLLWQVLSVVFDWSSAVTSPASLLVPLSVPLFSPCPKYYQFQFINMSVYLSEFLKKVQILHYGFDFSLPQKIYIALIPSCFLRWKGQLDSRHGSWLSGQSGAPSYLRKEEGVSLESTEATSPDLGSIIKAFFWVQDRKMIEGQTVFSSQ